MAEIDTSWHGSPGPQLDSFACQEKLYNLLCLFFASRSLASQIDDHVACPFGQMRDDHEQRLITRLLIEIAVLIRMKDDLFEQQHGVNAETEKDIVGTLRAPHTSATASPLHLREACNKIIHAKQLNFDVEGEPHDFDRFLNPVVFLYGEQRSVRWKAEVNIIKLVQRGYSMFP